MGLSLKSRRSICACLRVRPHVINWNMFFLLFIVDAKEKELLGNI